MLIQRGFLDEDIGQRAAGAHARALHREISNGLVVVKTKIMHDRLRTDAKSADPLPVFCDDHAPVRVGEAVRHLGPIYDEVWM